MRIDEIDLYGNILISGSTGSEGQILTYGNGGEFAWGTASGGNSGPTSSYFKTSGYNYVICETVNTNNPSTDAITNGDNLFNAYTLAKNLDVGTKSATNRVVVLLMPGDYDLSSAQFQLDTSFIDLVGISSNPYHTKLRSTNTYATLQYTAPVDSALKNVYLGTGAQLAVDDSEGYGNGSYLRWENVVLNNNIFWNGVVYGFSNIYGEFKNIKVTDSTISFVCLGVIDGIFDNIEVSDNAYAFYNSGGGDIIGTFSNISIGDACYAFYNSGGIYGNYQNITSGLNTGLFITSGTISGHFENIKVDNQPAFFITSGAGDLIGTYKNISLGNSYNCFHSYGNIDGIFEDIEIGNATLTFYIASSGYINGTFSNITVGNISSGAFNNSTSISGSFKDIKFGDTLAAFVSTTNISGQFENITMGSVTNNVFNASENIQGFFKNITIGNINDNNAFYASSGQIDGTFDEIKIGNIASSIGNFFASGSTMSGTFSNIEIGDAVNWYLTGIYNFSTTSVGSIVGTYKNIKVGSTSFLFTPTNYDLNGTFENIEFGATSYAFRTNAGSILGTYSNIKTSSQQERIFDSNTDLIGTFENIEISNSITTSTFNAQNSLSGTFKNIKIGDLSGIDGDVFYSGATDLTGTFENIEVGNGNSSYDIFKGVNIYGTYSNITIGDNFLQAFFASVNISGYYKDITIGDFGSGRIFYGNEISIGTTIDNLYSLTRIHSALKGRLINSTIIDVTSWQLSIDLSVSPPVIVENCKLITNGGGYSIIPSAGTSLNVQVLYTATNEGFDTSNGDILISPNYNITDAGLT